MPLRDRAGWMCLWELEVRHSAKQITCYPTVSCTTSCFARGVRKPAYFSAVHLTSAPARAMKAAAHVVGPIGRSVSAIHSKEYFAVVINGAGSPLTVLSVESIVNEDLPAMRAQFTIGRFVVLNRIVEPGIAGTTPIGMPGLVGIRVGGPSILPLHDYLHPRCFEGR